MPISSTVAGMLSYSTVKVVKVKDWVLGLIHYSLLLAIAAYIVYSIIANQLYLKKSAPLASSVRVNAQFRSDNALSTPAYCSSPEVAGCLFWNAEETVFPYSGEVDSIFITTRVTISTSAPLPEDCLNSDPLIPIQNDYRCTPKSESASSNKKAYYIANVENITLQIDHSVRSQFAKTVAGVDFAVFNELDMEGKLVYGCSNDKSKVVEFNEEVRQSNQKRFGTKLDVLSVSELLESAGCGARDSKLTLNDLANAPGAKPGETWRYTGMVVSVPIFYENRQSNSEQLKYRYIPAHLNGTEYKVVQHFYNANGTITYLNRHGIRVVFSQTGSIGLFDFQTLLINLVAAFALTKVATTLVDLLMLYAMPNRHLYQDAKFDEEIIDKSKSPDS